LSTGDYDVRVAPSLLDRLIDSDPSQPRDALPPRHETVRVLKRSIRTDLEHLLNARNPVGYLPEAFQEARKSVIAYGIPDFSSSAVAEADLIDAICEALRVFEPRLDNITATALPTDETDRTIRLRLDARLILDPSPEPVSFDIVMPMHTSRCDVKETF